MNRHRPRGSDSMHRRCVPCWWWRPVNSSVGRLHRQVLAGRISICRRHLDVPPSPCEYSRTATAAQAEIRATYQMWPRVRLERINVDFEQRRDGLLFQTRCFCWSMYVAQSGVCASWVSQTGRACHRGGRGTSRSRYWTDERLVAGSRCATLAYTHLLYAKRPTVRRGVEVHDPSLLTHRRRPPDVSSTRSSRNSRDVILRSVTRRKVVVRLLFIVVKFFHFVNCDFIVGSRTVNNVWLDHHCIVR